MRRRTKRKLRIAIIALPVAAAAGVAAFLLSGDDSVHHTTYVALVDQTSFGADHDLDVEASDRLSAIAGAAARDKGRLVVVEIGADAHSTRVAGTVEFDPPCENPDVCRKADETALDDAASLIGGVVSNNAGAQATDLFGALALAGSICNEQDRACEIDVISDGDQNDANFSLLGAIPDAPTTDLLIDEFRSGGRLPDLDHADITWTGIGTGGGTFERTAALSAFWQRYLAAAGADEISISRSVVGT